MDHSGPIPEQRHVCPGVGPADDRDVHEARGVVVAEVEGCLVEEVDDQQELGQPEPTTDPEHDEAEGEEIVLRRISASTKQLGVRVTPRACRTMMKCDPTLAAQVTKCSLAENRCQMYPPCITSKMSQ